jgi:hypothetical protein
VRAAAAGGEADEMEEENQQRQLQRFQEKKRLDY